jgi:hypothetical protein
MEKIPTAEELFETEYSIMDAEYPEMAAHVRRKVIEFAKLHVEAALKAASKNAGYHGDTSIGFAIDTETILTAYPLENIK